MPPRHQGAGGRVTQRQNVISREQLIGLDAVVGAGGFEQRDGLGHGAALHRRSAVQQTLQQLIRRQANVPSNQATAFLICSSTSLALAGIGVPGP